ncbi:MAG: HDOD domain-containing protein [Ketobacter sp.]|nr:MAG: HDOD domain-containing protein [Ketobacter sp.]
MSIPPNVADRLAQKGINYQILEDLEIAPLHQVSGSPQIDKSQIVQVIVLQDPVGKVQLLLPSNCLLDLQDLCTATNRNWQAISPSGFAELARIQDVGLTPGLPICDKLPLLVDQRLLKPACLFLELGDSGQFLKLEQAEFSKLVCEANICDSCVPLPKINVNQDDRQTVVDSVKRFTSLRVKRRLEETLEMPPLPNTAERIIQLRINPDAGAGDLAEVVEQDPSLAAQVVSWASSPYYAAPGAIKSVHDAVIRVLGFDLVINLSLGLALGKTLTLPESGPHGAFSYWRQAVYSATLMEGLVKAISSDYRPEMGLAYLSGLLSNYGYLVLAHIFPPYFSKLNRDIEANPHLDSFYIEQNSLGVDRETLASQLMECWNMPEEIIVALRWQHHPEFSGEHSVYSRLLHISHQLLRSTGMAPGPVHSIPDAYFQALHLDRDDAHSVLNNLVSKQDELLKIAKTMAS